nr:glycoside hydrolase family 88 protein [uncultured Carboxylicivirga sp.]
MNRLVFFVSIVLSSCSLVSQELPTKSEIINDMKKANDYWQMNNSTNIRSFWDHAAYHTGNMAAYQLTGINRYKKYSMDWAEYNEWKGAKSDIKENWKYSYGESDDYVLFGDWQICFQTYIDLYNLSETKDENMIARAREVMEYEMSTENNDYWWWADGLYMVMPVMTKLYNVTGNDLYLTKLYEYFKYAQSIMYDEETGLFFRDAKYVYPAHTSVNGFKDFWARGDGWVFAGLAKIIEDMPEDYEHRDEFISIYTKMAVSLKDCQQEEGYWTRSMLDPEHAPGPETSGTAFFTFGFAWGINNGYLDEATYLPTVKKSWSYLHNTALQADGRVGYVQPIGEKAIPGQIVDENSTADFGVGAFLLAASQMVHLAEGEMPEVPMVYMDSVKVVDENTLMVYFNEELEQTSAETAANYSIDQVSVISSNLDVSKKKVITLNFNSLSLGDHYLSIENIQGISGNKVEAGEYIGFSYFGSYTITASSFESGTDNNAEKAMDGSLDTRWSAFGEGEWLQFDMGKEKTVTSVDLAFFKGNERQGYFSIQLSTDGENFSTVYSGSSSGTTLELENYDFADQLAKYVRIIGMGNNSNAWNSITEVKINTETATDINSTAYSEGWKVFPNPYKSGLLTINTPYTEEQFWNLSIFDLSGKQVFSGKKLPGFDGAFSVSNLSLTKGLYQLLVSNSIKNITLGLVVQ